jgi:hypothetical protein
MVGNGRGGNGRGGNVAAGMARAAKRAGERLREGFMGSRRAIAAKSEKSARKARDEGLGFRPGVGATSFAAMAARAPATMASRAAAAERRGGLAREPAMSFKG